MKNTKINKENMECCHEHNKNISKRGCHCKSGEAIYGLGIFGALFYFLQNATTFGLVMVGIFKSIFWPAFVLYKILTLLQL